MYMEARQLHLNKAPNPLEDHSMAKVLRLLRQMNREHLLQPIPVEETNNAIEIMAEVRAYYEREPHSCRKARLLINLPHLVAFRRFVDNIPRIIDFELLKGIIRTIGVESKLFQDLVPENEDIHGRCTAFLKEDPEIHLSRKSLKQELDRLTAALESLEVISAVNMGPGSETDEVLAARLDNFPVHSSGIPPSRPSSLLFQPDSLFGRPNRPPAPLRPDSSLGRPTSPPAPSRPASPLPEQESRAFLFEDHTPEQSPYPEPYSSYFEPMPPPDPPANNWFHLEEGPSPSEISQVLPKKKMGKKPVRGVIW
jgi:Dynamin GTPase effector domain